jgi:hypothetical protein
VTNIIIYVDLGIIQGSPHPRLDILPIAQIVAASRRLLR